VNEVGVEGIVGADDGHGAPVLELKRWPGAQEGIVVRGAMNPTTVCCGGVDGGREGSVGVATLNEIV
jgi:hypothetical protein